MRKRLAAAGKGSAKTARADLERGANAKARALSNKGNSRESKGKARVSNKVSKAKDRARVSNKDSKVRARVSKDSSKGSRASKDSSKDKGPANRREWGKANRAKASSPAGNHLPVRAGTANGAGSSVPEASPVASKTGAAPATSDAIAGRVSAGRSILKPGGRWSAPCSTRLACCPL